MYQLCSWNVLHPATEPLVVYCYPAYTRSFCYSRPNMPKICAASTGRCHSHVLTHMHTSSCLSGLSRWTIALCTPGLLVLLNNVYAKQVRCLLTDLQNRMFHGAQHHCLLWWLPAICSGVSASIALHKIWKIHLAPGTWICHGLWKGTLYVLLQCDMIDLQCCHWG